MRRGALLLVVGIILLLGVGAVLVFGNVLTPAPTATVVATPRPPETKVLIAQQEIPRGQTISSDVIGEQTITGLTSREAKDQGMLEATAANRLLLEGALARQDIPADSPILREMILDAAGYLRGSEASLFIPPGMVAVALPADRLTTVAYAIQPGDHVDVIATFLVVNVDPDFQTLLPNVTGLLLPDGSVSEQIIVGKEGTLPPDDIPINEGPNPLDHGGQQRPRAVTQLTLENVLVLRYGEWPASIQPTPVPTAIITGTRTAPAQQQQAQGPTATPVPKPDIITLALDRQDALVLLYMLHTGTTMEFALRSAGDQQTGFNLQPVTLAYTFQRFQITEPEKLPFATEPGLWPQVPVQVVQPPFPTPPPHPNPTPNPQR